MHITLQGGFNMPGTLEDISGLSVGFTAERHFDDFEEIDLYLRDLLPTNTYEVSRVWDLKVADERKPVRPAMLWLRAERDGATFSIRIPQPEGQKLDLVQCIKRFEDALGADVIHAEFCTRGE